MRHIISTSCLIGVLLGASACTNAIMYGEQDMISVAIKGQPDPSAPLTGTIGVKQRVVAVVPPMLDPERARNLRALPAADGSSGSSSGQTNDGGDAVSLLSAFKFTKTANTGTPFDDEFYIRTSLITGDAAAELDLDQATGAARAIASTELAPTAITVIRLIYQDLQTRSENEASVIVGMLDALGNAVPQNYPVDVYGTGRGASGLDLRVDAAAGTPAPTGGSGLNNALTYWGNLQSSKEVLDDATAGRVPTFNGQALGDLQKAGLKAAVTATETELERIGRLVGASSAVDTAIDYWTNLTE